MKRRRRPVLRDPLTALIEGFRDVLVDVASQIREQLAGGLQAETPLKGEPFQPHMEEVSSTDERAAGNALQFLFYSARQPLSGPTTTFEELRRLYRRACLRLHPDRGGSDEQFYRLQEARATIERYYHIKL